MLCFSPAPPCHHQQCRRRLLLEHRESVTAACIFYLHSNESTFSSSPLTPLSSSSLIWHFLPLFLNCTLSSSPWDLALLYVLLIFFLPLSLLIQARAYYSTYLMRVEHDTVSGMKMEIRRVAMTSKVSSKWRVRERERKKVGMSFVHC